MELAFNESNKTIRISSVTMCEWSCIVTEGNFTLNKYYGKLPLNNSNHIDINLMTYSTDEIFGNITCVFKSDNCVTKKSLTLNQIPLHIFSVTNTDIFLFGEDTKSYVYVYYGIAQQNYDNVLEPLKLTIGNQTLRYDGIYSSIEITENGQKLYDITIQPYNQTLGLFEICFNSTCDLPFSDVIILEGVNDKNETQILHVNIKQGIVEHTPSLLNISPKFIFLSSDNPRQKINVTSLNNGIVGEYYISKTAPIQVQNNEVKNDVETYLNGDYSIEPYIDENLDVLRLVKEKNATHFILDMSDCENGHDNVDDGGNIPYELYVVNAKDNSMYHKLEFFYDYIFDADNYIQIESVTNAKAYIYTKNSGSDKGTIKSISADTDNKISLISDEFDMQISLTLLFIKKDTYNEQNFLKEEYIDYVIAEYNENENIIFTIKSKPDWWKILTLSDYVKEVKNGNDLSIALEKIIPNNGDIEYVTLENRLGKKCTIYLKTEGDIFANEIYRFGLSKNSGSTKPLSSLNIETKPKLFRNQTFLISESEEETIFTVDKTITVDKNKTSIELYTVFYIYDSNNVDTQIEKYTFDILYNSDIGKRYVNYGSISKKNINNKFEHVLKDNNMYYIEDNDTVLLPIPQKSKYIPWSIINFGTGIKYNVKTNLSYNNGLYYPNDSYTKVQIIDFVPSDLENNTIYLTPSLKVDTFEDISTIIFQQYRTLKESYLYINRKTKNSSSAFINKIGSSPSLNRMKYITSTSLNDVINANALVTIKVDGDDEKKAYYASYQKTSSFVTVDNKNVKFFILKEGNVRYENEFYNIVDTDNTNDKNTLYAYKGEIDDNENIDNIIDLIRKSENLVKSWSIKSGILEAQLNGDTKTYFPEIGIKQLQTDNKYYLYFEENDDDKLHFLLELEQKKSLYFGDKYDVNYDSNNKPYINVDCLYKVIEKSVLIDDVTYSFDEMGSFIYPYDNIRYFCYEENGEWYVDLNSKDFNIMYSASTSSNPIYYITILNENIFLDNFECTYNGNVFSPTLKVNLKGLSLEVLENIDGDTENEKEKYIILNNEKYVCNKIINDNLIFEYVDLGLPSGTLWAKTNVGAESEEDYGLYFSWGSKEGVTKEEIESTENDSDEDHFFFGKRENKIGELVSFIKINNQTNSLEIEKYTDTDEKTVLQLSDDGCHDKFQGNWHIPSIEQIEELIKNTTHERINLNGIDGFKLTSKLNQEAYIFIPCGVVTNSGTTISTDNISIWSNTLNDNDLESAYCLSSSANGLNINTYKRYDAMPIRGVGGVNMISLNHNYKLEIIENKVKFNDDYFLNIINEPSHEYVLINQEKHKLSNGVLIYENNKYIPLKHVENNVENKYVLINNKGYKVYHSEAYYYCIINNVKYTFDENSLSSDTISLIENVETVNKDDYYEINEIVNEEFSYFLDFNNLLDNDLITCSYDNKELSLGYVNINNKNYGIQKEFDIDTNTLDVIGNEYISIPLSEILKDINHNFNNFNISFNDETEIINHKTNTSTKYVSGNTLSYDDIDGLLLTINDYSKITFNSNIILQVKNNCKIIYHLENENIELDLLENETLFINSGIILTFSDVTKIKLINNNIPLYVFEDIAIIDNEAYTSTLSNDQKIITYKNNFYYVFNEKVDILGENYDVYEKSILYKIIGNNKVNTISHEIKKFNDDDTHTVHDYGYIDDKKDAIYLSKENYSGITYTLHLPVYDISKKWHIVSFELYNVTIYNINNTVYTRANFTYPNLTENIIIENGKFNFKVNVYEIRKQTKLETIIVINNSQTEFNDFDNNDRIYNFWDYYGNIYLKRIYTTNLTNLDLDVNKKINITNIKCKVDANKYVRVDGELCPIINTENSVSNYNDDGQFYVLYNDKKYPIVKGIAYINKNIDIIYGSENKVYAIFDADSYLTHNMHVLNTNEREGNVRMLKIKNAIDVPHNENIIIETKLEGDNYLYGKYLIEFNENEE